MQVPEQAFAELNALYETLEGELARFRRRCVMRGICCDFATHGHMLFVTGLEAAQMARCGQVPEPAQAVAGICPYLLGTRCGARDHRALGCRIYYCDTTYEEQRNEVYERFLKAIREIEARHGMEHTYQAVTKVDFGGTVS